MSSEHPQFFALQTRQGHPPRGEFAAFAPLILSAFHPAVAVVLARLPRRPREHCHKEREGASERASAAEEVERVGAVQAEGKSGAGERAKKVRWEGELMGGRTDDADGAGEQLFARSLARSSLIFEAGAAELSKLPSCPSLPCLSAVWRPPARESQGCLLCMSRLCVPRPLGNIMQYHLLPHISMLFRHDSCIP